MTYLDLVNDVLARLREDPVASVSTNSYSTLIGKYINDTKRSVEDAWNWDVLSVNTSLTTSAGVSNYLVPGSGYRQKGVTVNDTSNRVQLKNCPIQYILDQQQLSTVQSGNPFYFAWNGSNGTDSKVELYPTPNGAYSLYFDMFAAQAALSADTDVLLVPSEPVIAGAYARAIVERGEDGGLASSEAYGLYKGILADLISLESSRFVENDCFMAT